jgi:tRNA (guanine-N7-)-methyltransferase
MSDQNEYKADSSALRHREIRSFVLRQGRLTAGQENALRQLMPQFGFHLQSDWHACFKRGVVLEIGTGNGDALVACALQDPERDYLGAEVHAPGIGRVLLGIESNQLPNARIFHGDALILLRERIPDGGLSQINIWFPDPWHKARHHKRRMIQVEFVRLLLSKLSNNGVLHLATDWEPYAEHMREVLQQVPEFKPFADAQLQSKRPNTHFERRGVKLGHGVWDLLYRKTG